MKPSIATLLLVAFATAAPVEIQNRGTIDSDNIVPGLPGSLPDSPDLDGLGDLTGKKKTQPDQPGSSEATKPATNEKRQGEILGSLLGLLELGGPKNATEAAQPDQSTKPEDGELPTNGKRQTGGLGSLTGLLGLGDPTNGNQAQPDQSGKLEGDKIDGLDQDKPNGGKENNFPFRFP